MRNTRDDVIAAALGVLDAYGLEFCSMRRVASALDVQPSALYHHVPNKQSLLAFMADEIVRGVRGADPVELCRSLRTAMLSIRDGADVVATASAFRLGVSQVEAELADLVGVEGARTLLLYTFGHAQQSQTQLQAQAVGVLPQAADPRLTAEANTTETQVETAAELAAELDRSFDRGIAIILAGLRESELG
ncbi:MAG: TetR family transcriptional regulator [Leucobacter sp.]|jgi:AcrR family transcriptional regulator|nr:TetR family transcriptional regulator [Leucobacter sp.]